MDLINKNSPNVRLKYMEKELQGLRSVIAHLIGDDPKYKMEAFNAVYFMKSNYKDWASMIVWLKRNGLTGKKLVEFFQNESPDGGGYHMGATHIINRLEARKAAERNINVTELL